MAFFGNDPPVFTVDGTTLTLPIPNERQEFPELIAKQYIGVNDNLIVKRRGYRFKLNLIYNRPDDMEEIFKIANGSLILVTFGDIPVSYPVLVTAFLGEMDKHRDNNVIELEVKNIDLIQSIPSADDYLTIRSIGNGAIFLAVPN